MKLRNFLVINFFLVTGLFASTGSAFTPDEFNGTSLDPQWTFVDSAVHPGSTYTLTGSEVQIQSPPLTDYFFFVDDYGSIETTAPAGDNWEVVTKLNNWDPTQAGQQRQFCRAGIEIWQDNNHYITIGALSDTNGTLIGVQSFSNFNPVPGDNGTFEDGTDIFNTGVQTAYLFRIQKIDHHYRAAFSVDDGATWRNAAAVIKNTETADGYFTNEKIRLFTTSGFKEIATNAITPANFDYVHVNNLPPPAAHHPYSNDEFSGPDLGPQWTLFSGVLEGFNFFDTGTGEYAMTAGGLADAWAGKAQADYIYQDAPTTNSYTLTMKGGPTEFTAVNYELYNCYGIWLWHDSANWAFISNQRGEEVDHTPNNRIEYAVKHNRIFTNERITFGTSTSTPCPAYLRIAKEGNLVNLQYSFNNSDWTQIVHPIDGSTFDIGSDNLEVRLFTKRAFTDGAPIEARFDWLHAEDTTSDVHDWTLY